MFLLGLISLVVLASIYGIFFLIFKLIWLLFKKKRNFWPLVLSGITTFILAILAIVAVYQTYRYFLKPFAPIIQEIQNNPQPVYGEKTYTDPQFGFTLTQYDGVVFSDWIHTDKASLLFGVDTNPLKQEDIPADDIVAFFILHTKNTAQQDAQQLLQDLSTRVEHLANQDISVVFVQPALLLEIAPQATAALLSGQIILSNGQPPVPMRVMTVATQQDAFYLIGLGANIIEVEDTLDSFRLSE